MGEPHGDAPEDTYRFGWWCQRTTVVTRAESVEVEMVDWLGRPTWKRSVPLVDLSPMADHAWYDDVRFQKAVLGAICVAVPLGAMILFRMQVSKAAWLWFAGVLSAVVLGTVAYAVLALRGVEYAWVRYRSGMAAFTIGRSGQNAADFGGFVARLEERIRVAGR